MYSRLYYTITRSVSQVQSLTCLLTIIDFCSCFLMFQSHASQQIHARKFFVAPIDKCENICYNEHAKMISLPQSCLVEDSLCCNFFYFLFFSFLFLSFGSGRFIPSVTIFCAYETWCRIIIQNNLRNLFSKKGCIFRKVVV